MKKIWSCSIIAKLLAVTMTVCLWAASSMSASAVDFTFNLDDFTGDPAYVQVTIEDDGSGVLHFTVVQTNSTFDGGPTDEGDLRGLFFHMNEFLIHPDSTVANPLLIDASDLTFSNFVAWGFDPAPNDVLDFVTLEDPGNIYTGEVGVWNEVQMAGQQNVINPLKLDIGLEFGTAGENPDKILGVSFDMTVIGGLSNVSLMPIHMKDFIAARVTSLSGIEGSSKLSCCDDTMVPEPSSSAGLLAFAFGGLLWRRRLSK